MKLSRITVSIIMLALLLTSMLTSAFSFQSIFIFKAAHANSAATRVEKAVDFLIFSQFDSHLNLCREAPEAAPNRYWLVSDNLWAFRALKMANESGLSNAIEAGRVANLIEAKLKEKANIHNLSTDSDGFPISFMHEAVIGDSIPTPNRTCNNITLQSNDYTVRTEICNGTIMSDWQEYADRLLYMALSFYWQANDTAANYYFELLAKKAMWDGIGINDTVTKKDGNYTTFKLALLLFTSKILGEKLPFELELVNRIWSLQRETDGGIITNYFSNGTSYGDANTETTSLVVIAILATQRSGLGTFAFYYPWYGTSGRHWDHITNHPLLGFYDSNNETLIKEHISMAKEAGIDGFIVSWWGIGSFEDNATSHIRNVCEQNGFRFTIYYENTSGVNQTVNDIVYLLNNYANNSTWFRVDNRPVFYVYVRARNNLNPQAWKLYGNYINENETVINCWMLSEDVRKPPRYGIFQIHPYQNGIGYIESANPIFLPQNETYKLKTAISDIRNDCPNCSDVGFKIKIKNETGDWETLNESIVNFNDGWLDLSFDISNYAGQNVSIRVESFDGGLRNWCSEWAAVDYLYIENSKGEIVSPEPFFDNGWKNVVDELRNRGFNPYFIMDFTGYQDKIQDFAEYFLNFTDGMHYYSPVDISKHLSTVFHVYNQASDAAHSRNKTFVATVMPGYNDTNKPESVVDRQNGTYYTLFWSIAKACFPDGYAITSFNEWHEGTEIEPSLEYWYQYTNLTRTTPTIWTVDDDEPADFRVIQEAINTASPGDIVYVRNGTYYENMVVNKTILLTGESTDATVIDGRGLGTVIDVSSNNTIIKRVTIRNSGEKKDSEWPCGILLDRVSECGLIDNLITNDTLGILLDSSSLNLLKNNNITANRYNFGVQGLELSHFIQDVDTSNLVDGKPIYYWVNRNESEVPSDAGYVALVNSTNIMVRNLNLKNNLAGILITCSGNSTITNNTVSKNYVGIWLLFSSNDTVSGNNVTTNGLVRLTSLGSTAIGGFGVGVCNSSNNIISDNEISENNGQGISLYGFSNGNSILRNNMVGNSLKGIDLYGASYNNISWNVIANHTESTWFSVELDYFSSYNNICFNNITDNGNAISIESWSSYNRVYGNIVMRSGWYGINLISNANYNSILSNNITANNGPGIRLSQSSSNNTISGNNITANNYNGIMLQYLSNNNSISGNNIANNGYGIWLDHSSNNSIFYNNLMENTRQVSIYKSYSNLWDDGYPSGGNYWSDYNGTDLYSGPEQSETGSDGVGDASYDIDADNRDRYPLMGPFNTFDVGTWNGTAYNVDMVTNSTVSNFQVDAIQKTISFNVTGVEGAAGFCRVTIPNIIVEDLWQGNYTVLLNGEPLPFRNWTDPTYTYIYINYTHTEHEIIIIPEFPSTIILPLFTLTTLIATILLKKKRKTKPQLP